MSQALTFQSTTFDVVDQNGQPWLQARQIGQALGYSRSDAVLNLYERNKDEFTLDMSTTIELRVGLTPQETRIFSLRGCHLLAMFARTSVAKAFRVWVLDVLENLNQVNQQETLVSSTTPSTADDRKPLRSLVYAWSRAAGVHVDTCWPQVKAHFQLSRLDDLPKEWIPDALAFVQGKIDALPKALPVPEQAMPRIVTFEEQLERNFREIHRLIGEVFDRERDIYKIVRNGTTPALSHHDTRHTVLVNMHTVMDSLWYSIDSSLKAAEFHAKTMCVLSRP